MVCDIWDEFLKIAREEAGSRVVETWFKAVTLQRWDSLGKTVYLQTPNQFVRDWIKSHYTALIEVHLKRLLHVEQIKIIFVNAQEEVTVVPDEHALLQKTESKTTEIAIKTIASTQRKQRTYSFDTFVVGPNNSLAYAAAKAVAQSPGIVYNPLFIYGPSGLGKTHLLHAIGTEIKSLNNKLSILYQTADRFVNEFINAIRFDKIHHFQAKYKSVDVLLIDDIQFISNKEQTQEAFFHIFNALYDAEKQIIFSSDAFPQDISGLADRLRYRLAWGLVVDMQVPSLETKVAILKKKAEMNNEFLADDVAHFIASHVVTNIRELEGSLIRVIAFASLTKQPVTLELARKVLVRTHEMKTTPVGFESIIKCVSKYYPYGLEDLRSKNRNKELSFVRQLTMFLMKKVTDKSLRDIGIFMGGRDHSTVMHALDKVQTQAQNDNTFLLHLKKMEEDILGSSH